MIHAPLDATLTVQGALARLTAAHDLTSEQMAAVLGSVLDGSATSAQVGALLTALRMKGETVDEVVGAAQAMRARMLHVPFDAPDLVDTCGTGGDGSGSLNVSTLAAFIVAGCQVPVAKHGNRAQSSRSGAHDVIEALGLDPAPPPELAVACLKAANLAFLFAQLYHAATRIVAGPRRELGFRTLFNLLGPLTNPAGARHHLNGVFAADKVEFLARAHARLGARRALVVHGAGGLDEFTTAGETQVAELRADGSIDSYRVSPATFGLPEFDPAGLRGGEPVQNAHRLMDVLNGAPGAYRAAAVMTAGAALYVAGACSDLAAGAERAQAALTGGHAKQVLETLRRIAPLAPRGVDNVAVVPS